MERVNVNLDALIAAGFEGRYESDQGVALPARLAWVTPASVDAANALMREQPGRFAEEFVVECLPGTLLAAAQTESGERKAILPPHRVLECSEGDFGARLRLEELAVEPGAGNFLGRNAIGAWYALRSMAENGIATDAASATVAGLTAAYATVLEMSENWETAAAAGISDRTLQNAVLVKLLSVEGVTSGALDPEPLHRKMRADRIREAIAVRDPQHADAPGGDSKGLRDIFQDLDVAGVDVVPGSVLVGSANGPASQRSRAALDHLRRHVFAPLTRTAIEDLSISLVRVEAHSEIRQKLDERGRAVEGEWVDAYRQAVDRAIRAQVPAPYGYEMELFAMNGRDLLLVKDNFSSGFRDNDRAYVYSWPSNERRPVAEVDNAAAVMLSAADCPSEEEVARLERVYEEIFGHRFGEVPGGDLEDDYVDDADDDYDDEDHAYGF